MVADEGSGNAASLNEEFVVGDKAFQRLLILHKLHHFKYTTFKRCMAKVSSERGNCHQLDSFKSFESLKFGKINIFDVACLWTLKC